MAFVSIAENLVDFPLTDGLLERDAGKDFQSGLGQLPCPAGDRDTFSDERGQHFIMDATGEHLGGAIGQADLQTEGFQGGTGFQQGGDDAR